MFSSARTLAAAGAAAFALAAAAPVAQAEVSYIYDAHMTAGVDYETEEATESGKVVRAISAGFGVSGWFRDLRFVDGALLTQSMASGSRFYGVGAELKYQNDDVSPPDVTECAASTVEKPFEGTINPLRAFDPRAAPAALGVTPFSQVSIDLSCDTGGQVLGLRGRAHGSSGTGPGHLRLALTVPRDDLGDHLIKLRGRHTDRRLSGCPGSFVPPQLRRCVSTVYVELTLFRTFASEGRRDPLTPVVPKKPVIERGARRARATVRCPGGCRYRIRVFLPPRRGRGVLGSSSALRPAAAASSPRARAASTLASRSGRLPAGRAARSLALTIPAAKRAAILDDGGAVVELTLTAPRRRPLRATFFAPAKR